MNKFFILTLTITSILLFSTGVFAFSTTTYLQSQGVGSYAQLSPNHVTSGVQSVDLYAPFDNANGPEGRVRIQFNEPVTLNDIANISWQQYVAQGYASHVDVKIDTDNNGTEDDALVFEYAKVSSANCDATPYPTGQMNTFGTLGIVNNAAMAWLSSGDAGPCGGSPTFYWHSLTDWKLGNNTNGINGSTKVTAFEIEVDGWIEQSEAFIDDVMLNGQLIQNFEGTQIGSGEVGTDFTFLANPNPLNFGTIVAGHSGVAVSTLTVGASNLKVQNVAVTSIIGTVFNGTNVLFSQNGGISYMSAPSWTPLSIPHNTVSNLHVKLTIPSGTPSGAFSGQIVYTVMEAI
ncbi:hypothetical protein J4233_04505 [Candidatus Pacearchaeota archaeon]|nr:hypothetical protein [Candidatus Pacearchaeota archaeon]